MNESIAKVSYWYNKGFTLSDGTTFASSEYTPFKGCDGCYFNQGDLCSNHYAGAPSCIGIVWKKAGRIEGSRGYYSLEGSSLMKDA
jgi:hypothetical protein